MSYLRTKGNVFHINTGVKGIIAIFLVFFLVGGISGSVLADSTKTITDMRGNNITIPANPERVVIMNAGFLAQLTRALGVSDKIKATGGLLFDWEDHEENNEYVYLNPEFINLPNINGWQTPLNAETLAFTNPDLVIWEDTEYTQGDKYKAQNVMDIDTIEKTLKKPLVLVKGTGLYGNKDNQATYDTVTLMGEIFNNPEKAKEINEEMKKRIEEVQERTKDIPNDQKPKVMFLGLTDKLPSPTWPGAYGDAKFSDNILNVKNVLSLESGQNLSAQKLSAEQIIKLNPEVIVLTSYSEKGLNPDIFKEDDTFKELRNVDAVKNDRVVSVGDMTWIGDYGLDTPMILMTEAKGAYPDKFKDINVRDWSLDYLKKIYDINDDEAIKLYDDIIGMSWTKEKNF